MATFADLDFKPHPGGFGVQAKKFFANGYGASVIQSRYSYGGDEGKYELGVYEGDDASHCLTYETPVTDDVLGYLTEDDVTKALAEIEALPPASRTPAQAVAASKAKRTERLASLNTFLAKSPA